MNLFRTVVRERGDPLPGLYRSAAPTTGRLLFHAVALGCLATRNDRLEKKFPVSFNVRDQPGVIINPNDEESLARVLIPVGMRPIIE